MKNSQVDGIFLFRGRHAQSIVFKWLVVQYMSLKIQIQRYWYAFEFTYNTYT
jgi:hypothetical protein